MSLLLDYFATNKLVLVQRFIYLPVSAIQTVFNYLYLGSYQTEENIKQMQKYSPGLEPLTF